MAKKHEPFETIIHETLKEAGLLFPISEKEIEDFESRFTNLTLPEKLRSAESILNRNRQKIHTAHQPVLQAAALFDSTEAQSVLHSNATSMRAKKSKKHKK